MLRRYIGTDSGSQIHVDNTRDMIATLWCFNSLWRLPYQSTEVNEAQATNYVDGEDNIPERVKLIAFFSLSTIYVLLLELSTQLSQCLHIATS